MRINWFPVFLGIILAFLAGRFMADAESKACKDKLPGKNFGTCPSNQTLVESPSGFVCACPSSPFLKGGGAK